MRSRVCFIALVACLVFASCKKYEDAPLISFRSKKSKVVGDWKVNNAFVLDNSGSLNEDSLTIIAADSLIGKQWEFAKNNKYKTIGESGSVEYADIEWQPNSSFRRLVLDYSSVGLPIQSWRIVKFYYKDLWLRMEVDERLNVYKPDSETFIEVHLSRL